jgi:predicted metal-binding membrane protein
MEVDSAQTAVPGVAAAAGQRGVVTRSETALNWAGAAWAVAALAVAAVAWAGTARLMDGMDDGPGTDLGSLGFFIGAWVLMMTAMMLPASVPTIVGQARQQTAQLGPLAAAVPILLFALGYIATWTAFGFVAYAVFKGVQALDLSALGWDQAGRYVAAGAIATAGAYQLTASKDGCLGACRVGFEASPPTLRGATLGAIKTGVRYGVACVGCCWALFVGLFALGVMSLQWMVVLAVVILVERLLPWRGAARLAVAALLIALCVGVAASPGKVPGLTTPGHGAMHAMQMGPAHKAGSMGGMHSMSGPAMGHKHHMGMGQKHHRMGMGHKHHRMGMSHKHRMGQR